MACNLQRVFEYDSSPGLCTRLIDGDGYWLNVGMSSLFWPNLEHRFIERLEPARR